MKGLGQLTQEDRMEIIRLSRAGKFPIEIHSMLQIQYDAVVEVMWDNRLKTGLNTGRRREEPSDSSKQAYRLCCNIGPASYSDFADLHSHCLRNQSITKTRLIQNLINFANSRVDDFVRFVNRPNSHKTTKSIKMESNDEEIRNKWL